MFKYIFILCSFWLPLFAERHTVYNVQEEYFSIKGIYFHYDKNQLAFPIELGDKFDVSDEKVENLPGGGKRWTVLLTSPISKAKQYFQSIIINPSKTSKIVSVFEKNWTVEKKIITYISFNEGGKSEIDRLTWTILTQFDALLDDGTTYEVNFKVCTFDESKVPEFLAEARPQEGDVIVWGAETMAIFNAGNGDVTHHKFHFADITREGKSLPLHTDYPFADSFELFGFKRFKDKDTDEFETLEDSDGHIRFDKFGANLKFTCTSEKYDYWETITKGSCLYIYNKFKYKGFQYINNRRVYIFDHISHGKGRHPRRFFFTPMDEKNN